MAFHSYDVGDLGCLLQVGLRVGQSYARIGRGGRPSSWTALLDTGSTKTVISPSIVRDLAPQTAASAVIRRPGSAGKRVIIYDIELKLDGHLSAGHWFELKVVGAQPATPGIDILLGMDLLKQLHLYYAGPDGKMVLSY